MQRLSHFVMSNVQFRVYFQDYVMTEFEIEHPKSEIKTYLAYTYYMKTSNVLIIGAGATGLMAARQLVKAGKTVTVLEARNHTGGRIHTLSNELFFQHAELGAEFVHGNLPVTLQLLDEAGIKYYPAGGELWQYKNGRFEENEQFVEGWDELLNRLGELKEDLPISHFLDQYFAGEKHESLRKSVLRFVAGYDTAQPDKASAFALRNEWQHEDDDAQHRVEGGYCAMIRYLADECKAAGNKIILNAIVKEIHWQANAVKAITIDGAIYEAEKLIIAMPLGVLQTGKGDLGAINFNPAIYEYTDAIDKIGFGAILKVLLEFDEPFWETYDIGTNKQS
jgi:monoamine oxidase